jgi:ribosomal protein S18 acetylase RimI-like enzyme
MYNIRKSILNDIPGIERLFKTIPSFWDNKWRPDILKMVLTDQSSLSFVCEEENDIVGFVCAHDNGFRAYLSELIVSPQSQNKGIGKELLKRIETELQNRNIKIIISDVWKDARSFYEQSGWESPKAILLKKEL